MSQPSRNQPSQGCSCGQCAGGWLSPRMSYQLQRQAEFALVGMYANPEERTFDLNVDPSFVSMLTGSEYLPPSVFKRALHPTFYGGYTAVFCSALEILQRAPASPLTEDAVKAHVLANYPQVVERFFPQGGRVVYAQLVKYRDMRAEDTMPRKQPADVYAQVTRGCARRSKC